MGTTKKEAFEELVKEDLETMENAERRFKRLEERIEKQHNRRKELKI